MITEYMKANRQTRKLYRRLCRRSKNASLGHNKFGYHTSVATLLLSIAIISLGSGCHSNSARKEQGTAKTQSDRTQADTGKQNDIKDVEPKSSKKSEQTEVKATPKQFENRVEPHPDTPRFKPQQLVKDHTVFVLAFDSVTRQNYFLYSYRGLINETQTMQVRDLTDSYKDKFSALLNKRNEILEIASDDIDIATLLKNNDIETLLLNREIRRTIFRQILTEEQKEIFKSAYDRKKTTDEKKAPDKPPADKEPATSHTNSGNTNTANPVPK